MSSPWPTPPVFVLAIALAAITVTASFSTFYGKSHTCVDVCIRAQWTGDNNNNRREDANALSKEQLVHKHCTETWADAWPTISFTGALAPEYYIFAVGLSLTAIVGFVALIHLHRNVHAAALKTKPCCGCCVSPCEHVHAGRQMLHARCNYWSETPTHDHRGKLRWRRTPSKAWIGSTRGSRP